MTQANEGRAQASDRWIIRLYLEGAGEPEVYENVKHIWWAAGHTVLVVLQYYPDGSWRYINWPREQIWYYTRSLHIPPNETKSLAHIAHMDETGKQGICYCEINQSHPGPGLVP